MHTGHVYLESRDPVGFRRDSGQQKDCLVASFRWLRAAWRTNTSLCSLLFFQSWLSGYLTKGRHSVNPELLMQAGEQAGA